VRPGFVAIRQHCCIKASMKNTVVQWGATQRALVQAAMGTRSGETS
jgi:hypothetical protein